MKKIIVSSAVVMGIVIVLSRNASADAGPPKPAEHVPDSGSTALLLASSVAAVELVRRSLSRKRK